MRFRFLLLLSLLFSSLGLLAQGTAPFKWTVTAKKIGERKYELEFRTAGAPGWQLYQPEQANVRDVEFAELQSGDSAALVSPPSTEDPATRFLKSPLFDGVQVAINEGAVTWKSILSFSDAVPAQFRGTLLYTYGRADEFYPGTEQPFTVALEGGVAAQNRILIPSINVHNPVSGCGDEVASDKSSRSLFFVGFGAGLLALLFPCIFPLIPLTVSFFTKRAPTRRRGVRNAFLYGFSIFVIYAALSLPFHLFRLRPEVLNNISTNVTLNIVFFIIFIVFAISFFGAFEITLPSGLATRVDSKSGASDIWGIFFMALTLTIVSFSCTSGILGALIAGSLNGSNAAWQLTAGMS
ncbi:MAG: cytochrome C biogenesis protein, partial [Sphingobacteriales bacterium]